jgi:succinyl-diaminopimelate desuccinylase
MAAVPDVTELLVALVRAPSVTPEVGPVLDVLAHTLAPAGFEIARPVFAERGALPVENFFAGFGQGSRHVVFAGHVDVVPPGPESLWRHPPFSAEIVDGVLFGRGAVDMKGGIAAMTVAAMRFAARRGPELDGRISLLVTGDEEGPSVNGTAKLLDWATRRGERFSAAIVGEPTSARQLGDQIKIGRRGSFSATVTVTGRQGHAAYPDDAENPIRGLTQLLYALQSEPLDDGSERFDPSTLEIVSVDVGNPAWNVIPAVATARLNSRYNDLWTRETLRAELERRLSAAASQSALRAQVPIQWSLAEEPASADVFLTQDETLIVTISDAVEAVTGRRPALSTTGGTSDARFIKDYCPVVEFGPVGATMHAVDERVPLADIEQAARIYEAFLDAYFPP